MKTDLDMAVLMICLEVYLPTFSWCEGKQQTANNWPGCGFKYYSKTSVEVLEAENMSN
jgi:hypothetical protein